METKQAITPLTFEDIKKFSEVNTEMIYEFFNKFDFYDQETDEKIVQPIIQEILDEMKISIPSISILRQNQPTRFMMLLTEEILRASEKIKRRSRGNAEATERDINKTRNQVMNNLSQTYRTETVLFSLLDSKQFDQALTMIEALEIERSKSDLIMKVEVLNWKLELMSKMGNVNGFFETLSKLLTITNGEEMKYDPKAFKSAIEYILMKKFDKGIPFSLNAYGRQQARNDVFIPTKVGEAFQELLVNKVLDAVMKTRIIDSSSTLNQFLKSEWSNIVQSFHLINPYVAEIPQPNI